MRSPFFNILSRLANLEVWLLFGIGDIIHAIVFPDKTKGHHMFQMTFCMTVHRFMRNVQAFPIRPLITCTHEKKAFSFL
jgi:hypothetical protein